MSQNRPRRRVQNSISKTYNYNFVDPLAKWINQKFDLEEKLSSHALKKLIWVSGLVLIYVYFQHNFDGLIRKLNKTESEVNEQRAAYISYKSNYLYASKQSEVEKKLSIAGFIKNEKPPIKISE